MGQHAMFPFSLAPWMEFFGLHDSSKYIGTPQSIAIRNPDCTVVNHLISLVGHSIISIFYVPLAVLF